MTRPNAYAFGYDGGRFSKLSRVWLQHYGRSSHPRTWPEPVTTYL